MILRNSDAHRSVGLFDIAETLDGWIEHYRSATADLTPEDVLYLLGGIRDDLIQMGFRD